MAKLFSRDCVAICVCVCVAFLYSQKSWDSSVCSSLVLMILIFLGLIFFWRRGSLVSRNSGHLFWFASFLTIDEFENFSVCFEIFAFPVPCFVYQFPLGFIFSVGLFVFDHFRGMEHIYSNSNINPFSDICSNIFSSWFIRLFKASLSLIGLCSNLLVFPSGLLSFLDLTGFRHLSLLRVRTTS